MPTPRKRNLPPDVPHDQAADYFLHQLEQVLADRHEEIAALVIEPLLQAAAGMVVHPPGFLRGVRELTSRYDVLLIADEIVTGFGRTGRMFACEHEGVVPELLCLGKGITAGYLPLAATIASGELYRTFLGKPTDGRAFLHGHTYGGNPLAAAAALASLDVFQQERVLEQIGAKAEQLSAILTELGQHAYVGQTRQLGLIAAIELVQDRAALTPFPADLQVGKRVCAEATRRGVWLRPLGDVVVVMPPLAVNADQLQMLGEVIGASIETVTNKLLTATSRQ